MPGDVDYPPGCHSVDVSASDSELAKRFKKIADSLYSCEPNSETGDTTRFRQLFLHLCQSEFINKKNSDVRIYLANCLSSIIRLYHPEVPTNQPTDINEVYNFLIKVLANLGKLRRDNPMMRRYNYLAESFPHILFPLMEIKESDENDSIDIYTELYKAIFSITCTTEWTKNMNSEEKEANKNEDDIPLTRKILNNLIQIGVTVIHDLDVVPYSIVDILFHYLVEPQKSQNIYAYHMSKEIISKCVVQLERLIQNILQSCAMFGELSEEFPRTGTKSRSKFYDLIISLNKIGHNFVSTSVPYLVRWLKVESEDDRISTVKLFGNIASHDYNQAISSEHDIWKSFIASSRDNSVEVRLEFVRQANLILNSKSLHLRGSLNAMLINLSKDVDASVRREVVETVVNTAKCKLDAVNDKLLKAISNRMRDKKHEVREAAIKNLMSFYNSIMANTPCSSKQIDFTPEELPEYTDSDKEIVQFIPSAVLNIFFASQKSQHFEDVKLTIERYFQLHFIPFKLEAKERVKIMLNLYRNLNDIGLKMFNLIVERSSKIRRSLIAICNDISSMPKENSDRYMQILRERIRRLSRVFPDHTLYEKVIKQFVNIMSVDENVFELVKNIISDNYVSSEMETAAISLISIVREKKVLKSDKEIKALRSFVERCAPLAMDSLSAQELLDAVFQTIIGFEQKKKDCIDNYRRDLELLKVWIVHFSHLFSSEEMVAKIRKNLLNFSDHLACEISLLSLNLLLGRTSFKQKIETEAEKDSKWFQKFMEDLKYFLSFSDPKYEKCCKLATRLIGGMLSEEKLKKCYEPIISELTSNLNLNNEGCGNSLQSLAEIFATDPNGYFEEFMKLIETKIMTEDMLLSREVCNDDFVGFNPLIPLEKQNYSNILRNKIISIKFTTKVFHHYCMKCLKDAKRQREIREKVKPFITKLEEIIIAGGSNGQPGQSQLEKAWMRSIAGTSILKLCCFYYLRSELSPQGFLRLSYLIMDDLDCVQNYFATRLRKYLSKNLLIEFAGCYALVNLSRKVDENDFDRKNIEGFRKGCNVNMTSIFKMFGDMTATNQSSKAVLLMYCPESVVFCSTWLLANYDQLKHSQDTETLKEIKEALWFVIHALSEAKCDMQKVYKAFETMKTLGDRPFKDSHENDKDAQYEQNKKIWSISDLAINMLMYRAKLQLSDEAKCPAMNKLFFYRNTDRTDPSDNFAPEELLQESGKVSKTGKVLNATKNETAAAVKRKKRNKANDIEISLEDDEESVSIDNEVSVEVASTSKEEPQKSPKKRTRPLKENKNNEDVLENAILSPIVNDDNIEEESGTRKLRSRKCKIFSSTPLPSNKRKSSEKDVKTPKRIKTSSNGINASETRRVTRSSRK